MSQRQSDAAEYQLQAEEHVMVPLCLHSRNNEHAGRVIWKGSATKNTLAQLPQQTNHIVSGTLVFAPFRQPRRTNKQALHVQAGYVANTGYGPKGTVQHMLKDEDGSGRNRKGATSCVSPN